MTPERYKLVEEVFHAATSVEPSARRELVSSRLSHDSELLERVLSLLHYHEAGGVDSPGEFARALRGVAEAAITPAASGSIPTRIASYRILRPLGEGGFGMVYLAEQDHPRRTVALKLLRTAFTSGEVARRFEYEARILARLRHPGIAQIYEAGSAEIRVTDANGRVVITRQPFLALEYVEGPNLVDFALGVGAQQPALPIQERLSLFARVCDALQHAHQHGVIHRDLKPDNILVSCEQPAQTTSKTTPSTDGAPSSYPKLLDFGVARVMDADPDLTRAHTGAGRMIGTLAYMSPEQVAGDSQAVDTRSDIYAMGVVLYQLLTGSLPYDVRDVPLDQAIRIVREREPPPLRSLDRALRTDAHAVIQKAMSKERDRRYASMAEFAADVRRLLSGQPVAAKGDSRWYVIAKSVRRHRVAIGVAAAFVLVLASSSVMGWLLYVSAQRARTHSATLLRESYVNEARATRAGNGVGRRFGPLESLKKAAALRMGPDLRSEAIAAFCIPDFRVIREFPRGGGSGRGLTTLDRMALTMDDGSMRVVNIESGHELRRIPARDAVPIRVRFNKSGDYLGALYVAEGKTTVVIWLLDKEEPVLLRTVPFAVAEFSFGAGDAGTWAAVPSLAGTLERVALPSGEVLATLRPDGNAGFMTASPDGSKLAIISPSCKKLTVVDSLDGRTLAEWTSPAVLRSPSWSPDARMIGAGGDDSRIHLWDVVEYKVLPSIEGHRATVAELVLGADLVASGSWDGTVRVWDARTKMEVFTPIVGAELQGFDARRLVIANDQAIRVFELEDDSPRQLLRASGPLGAEATVDFAPSSAVMAIAGVSGVQVWDMESWKSVTLTKDEARSVMVPGDGSSVLALVGNELRRWDFRAAWESEAGQPASERVWGGKAVAWGSLSPDRKNVYVMEHDQLLRIDLTSGVATPVAPVSPMIERPIVDSTGRWLFVGTWRGAPAQVFDLSRGKPVLTLGESSVRGAFSPDSRLLTVGEPGRQLIFECGRWDAPRELRSSESGLHSVAGASAVSRDGKLMAYVEAPHVIRLADPRTATILATLPNAERFGIPDLRFSPDGRRLIVLTLDETIIVWQLDQLREKLESMGMGW